jgi:hypothetical protein
LLDRQRGTRCPIPLRPAGGLRGYFGGQRRSLQNGSPPGGGNEQRLPLYIPNQRGCRYFVSRENEKSPKFPLGTYIYRQKETCVARKQRKLKILRSLGRSVTISSSTNQHDLPLDHNQRQTTHEEPGRTTSWFRGKLLGGFADGGMNLVAEQALTVAYGPKLLETPFEEQFAKIARLPSLRLSQAANVSMSARRF